MINSLLDAAALTIAAVILLLSISAVFVLLTMVGGAIYVIDFFDEFKKSACKENSR